MTFLRSKERVLFQRKRSNEKRYAEPAMDSVMGMDASSHTHAHTHTNMQSNFIKNSDCVPPTEDLKPAAPAIFPAALAKILFSTTAEVVPAVAHGLMIARDVVVVWRSGGLESFSWRGGGGGLKKGSDQPQGVVFACTEHLQRNKNCGVFRSMLFLQRHSSTPALCTLSIWSSSSSHPALHAAW